MAHDRALCSNTKFVDVDFEELMMTKREIILNTPKMRDMLSPDPEQSLEKGIVLDTDDYVAIGCDLRNLQRLERLLKSVVDIDQCLVLCVAEVSITYMATEDADALISWSTTLSPGRSHLSIDVPRYLTDPRCHILLAGATVTRSAGQPIHCSHVNTFCQTRHTSSLSIEISW